MVEALATKNKDIEALVSSMDSLKKQAALSEGNLASLQVLYIPLFSQHCIILSYGLVYIPLLIVVLT